MSIPDKVALFDDKTASFLCVSGEDIGMNFIQVQGQNFAMQETEFTRGQWKALMGYYPEANALGCTPDVRSDDQPVSCVSALDADNFAMKMTRKNDGHTYRLSSEQEWETAAGDFTGTVYGWCDSHGTHAVKQLKAPNGLYDMVGNVWEGTSSKPDCSSSDRVVRGGSFLYFPGRCRPFMRDSWSQADTRFTKIGFRLLRQP